MRFVAQRYKGGPNLWQSDPGNQTCDWLCEKAWIAGPILFSTSGQKKEKAIYLAGSSADRTQGWWGGVTEAVGPG